jgi:ABC-type bacteriocin/lantibiotic exporter with double-glycine peptidase domain
MIALIAGVAYIVVGLIIAVVMGSNSVGLVSICVVIGVIFVAWGLLGMRKAEHKETP